MKAAAGPLAALLLAACAVTPEDPLVWSDEIARALPLEGGEAVAVARFSSAPPGEVAFPWEPYVILRGNVPTDYRVVELDGTAAVAAESRTGSSALYRKIRIDPRRHPLLEWRWRLPSAAAGEPTLRETSGKSPAARVSLAFHGDTSKLDFEDRTQLRLAKALTALGLPYASLVYAWMDGVPVGTVLPSPYTKRARVIVVENGETPRGEWLLERRNVLEDYRRAFGEEPVEIVAVGVMTDYGDDGSPRRAYYGDITFRAAPD
ncbi:MAG TPA: DUF3047 domain-containing protein [Burkholderiales bacterium]|nr:DUF3047 domain-containing protein [Burkholderiales bacterium]